MACRLLYNNLITAASMITPSSQAGGVVTSAVKDGTGSAVITPSGSFSGSEPLDYTVEIDDVSGGTEIGQATFRWKDDSGGGWDATGVTTATTNVSLNNSVVVKWTQGSGADVALNDIWYFKAIATYGAGKLIDNNRDTSYRSDSATSINIVVDLSSAQEIKALCLYDHNLSSGATITLEGHTADSWGTPDFSDSVTFNSSKILHFLSAATTKRYWRIVIADAGNSDGYISIGSLYLGSYFEPTKTFTYSSDFSYDHLFSKTETLYGIEKNRYYNVRNTSSYDFRNLANADITTLKTVLDTIVSQSAGTKSPLYWIADTTDTTDFYLMHLDGINWAQPFSGYNNTTLNFREVLKSV